MLRESLTESLPPGKSFSGGCLVRLSLDTRVWGLCPNSPWGSSKGRPVSTQSFLFLYKSRVSPFLLPEAHGQRSEERSAEEG